MPLTRRAVVTGGSGALGMAVYEVLARDGYEVHVTVSSERSADGLVREAGIDRATVHVANLTSDADAERLFQAVGGPLGALVTTVGGFAASPMSDVTAPDVDRMTDINLKATLLTVSHAHPSLRQSEDGAGVVMVASKSGLVGEAGAALYSATKASIVNLAASLSREWLEDDIRVNAVLPSIFDTPANRAGMPDADYSKWPKPREIAEVIAFLVSDRAKIVSGGAIPVYGKA